MEWLRLSAKAKIVLGIVAGITAAIIGISQAWSVLDLPVIATRGWVHAQFSDRLKRQSDSLYQIRRGQLDREIFDLERREKRNQSDEWRLHQLQDELKKLDAAEK